MSAGGNIILGVTGSPVFHSKSPLIFRSVFRDIELDASYIRIAVKRADHAVRLCRELGFTGMNVTAPFKQSIIGSLDDVSEEADRLQSVNTVVSRGGRLSGYSTDHYGVTIPLEKRLGPLNGRTAVIAGAGGAGIAAAFGLVGAGCRVTVLNITIDEARDCAAKFGCGYDLLSNAREYLPYADIMVSALPFEAEPLDISLMKNGSVVMDASYKNSHYSRLAEISGLEFIPGEQWLVHQAIAACGHFLGFTPDEDTALRGAQERRSLRGILALTGFMGSGKSSVGRELARIRGMEFVDIDTLIEQRAGVTINEIFRLYGEERFRAIETETLHSFKGRSGIVLSCGGGIVLSGANRDFLRNETECIWLYCGMNTMLGRVNDGTRPLINAMKDPVEAVELFKSRMKFYAGSCESLVLTESTPEITAEHINEEIRLSF